MYRGILAGWLAGLLVVVQANAVISLVDKSHLEYQIQTDVATATSLLASGAAKDATYTTSVTGITTSLGATVKGILNNAFEGYNGLVVNGVSYNENGTVTTECEGATSLVDRTVVFAPKTIGALTVSRKVFVPDNDAYCRWLNIITNTSTSQQAVTVTIVSQLGSGIDTLIATTSSAPTATATTADRWVVSYKNYTAGHSSDPRLGHILQGDNRQVGLAQINFVNGDDKPVWEYSTSIPAGQTYIIMNLVTGQPSIAAAQSQCENLAANPQLMTTCMSSTEISEVVNFDLVAPTVSITSSSSSFTNSTSIPVTVTFSKPVTGFVQGDLTVVNATVDGFSGNGTTFTFNLHPIADGLITVDIAAGVAQDAAHNGNIAANQFKVTVDTQPPTVFMTSTTPDPSNISTVIKVYVQFSEPVTGFTQADIIPINAKFHKSVPFNGSGGAYYFALLPLVVTGQVGASIPANVCTDAAGNGNLAAPDFLHTVGPGASCFASAKSGTVPLKAGLVGLAPIGIAMFALAAMDYRKRRRRAYKTQPPKP